MDGATFHCHQLIREGQQVLADAADEGLKLDSRRVIGCLMQQTSTPRNLEHTFNKLKLSPRWLNQVSFPLQRQCQLVRVGDVFLITDSGGTGKSFSHSASSQDVAVEPFGQLKKLWAGHC
jgi:hypothetical protein